MLTHLHIRHFAIIDSSELELDEGMTALTGETGAGKSILLDALGLVLGGRASSESIQQDRQRADITATFSLEKLPEVCSWLKEHALDSDQDCIVRRTLNANGKSRASINDIPVSVQILTELGQRLVTIHGQNAQHGMGKSGEQRRLLDTVAGTSQRDRVAAAFNAWKQADDALENLESQLQAREQRVDLLSFQLQEFDELDLGPLSLEEIESEHRWLANADKVMALGDSVLHKLDVVAYPALIEATAPLAELAAMDERLREACDLIDSAGIQVAEAVQSIGKVVSSLEHDDARLQWLDQKIAAMHRLAKKHQCDMLTLARVEEALRDEYQALLDPASSADELTKERDALRTVYDTEAGKLTRHRKKHAKVLARAITEAMQGLNMQGGVFDIEITQQHDRPTVHGQDGVVFMVSPNPGVRPAPLSRVASGGELSRISLCLQLATLDQQSVPTLVFDEVDSGVGGAVAEKVGQLLRQVGSRAQVLCVTHLPQVAAQAHHHLKVTKAVVDKSTRTAVEPLNKKATIDEIARMLGGAKLTKKSRQHAQEMLDSAAS